MIPAHALQELARIVANADDLGILRVSRRANQVVFEAGDIVLSSRLIDGQFPNYKQLLPDSFEHELTLATGEFTDVVRRISLMAQKDAPLRLSFTDGRVTVSARTPDVGEASQSVEIPFAETPFDVGFNPDFCATAWSSPTRISCCASSARCDPGCSSPPTAAATGT